MTTVSIIMGRAMANALAFSRSNFFFSTMSTKSINKEGKGHDKAMKDMQQAQIDQAKKRLERLNYINNEIMKEHKAISKRT